MPNPMSKADGVEYVAGRNFVHNGVKYAKGDDVPEAAEWNKLEAMVRSRYLIAVVEDYNESPRHLRGDVWPRSLAFQKMGLADTREARKGKRIGNSQSKTQSADVDSFSPWEETSDNAEAIASVTQENIEKENEMTEAGKQETQFVDGVEQTEPVEMIGETARDADVEVREVDEPENTVEPPKEVEEQHPSAEDNKEPFEATPKRTTKKKS